MLKSDAIRLLGGTPKSAAEACQITKQAVSLWPEVLTRDIEDRVLAALARKHLPPELLLPPVAEPVTPEPPPPDFEDTLPVIGDPGEHAHAVDVVVRGDGTVSENERYDHSVAARVPDLVSRRLQARIRLQREHGDA